MTVEQDLCVEPAFTYLENGISVPVPLRNLEPEPVPTVARFLGSGKISIILLYLGFRQVYQSGNRYPPGEFFRRKGGLRLFKCCHPVQLNDSPGG